uniref:Uncharacterized protein n=1 Tax=Sphaerodactylus townsendi TaxID=933632 RepID=A0ACB8GD58_9SAUR
MAERLGSALQRGDGARLRRSRRGGRFTRRPGMRPPASRRRGLPARGRLAEPRAFFALLPAPGQGARSPGAEAFRPWRLARLRLLRSHPAALSGRGLVASARPPAHRGQAFPPAAAAHGAAAARPAVEAFLAPSQECLWPRLRLAAAVQHTTRPCSGGGRAVTAAHRLPPKHAACARRRSSGESVQGIPSPGGALEVGSHTDPPTRLQREAFLKGIAGNPRADQAVGIAGAFRRSTRGVPLLRPSPPRARSSGLQRVGPLRGRFSLPARRADTTRPGLVDPAGDGEAGWLAVGEAMEIAVHASTPAEEACSRLKVSMTQ